MEIWEVGGLVGLKAHSHTQDSTLGSGLGRQRAGTSCEVTMQPSVSLVRHLYAGVGGGSPAPTEVTSRTRADQPGASLSVSNLSPWKLGLSQPGHPGKGVDPQPWDQRTWAGNRCPQLLLLLLLKLLLSVKYLLQTSFHL